MRTQLNNTHLSEPANYAHPLLYQRQRRDGWCPRNSPQRSHSTLHCWNQHQNIPHAPKAIRWHTVDGLVSGLQNMLQSKAVISSNVRHLSKMSKQGHMYVSLLLWKLRPLKDLGPGYGQRYSSVSLSVSYHHLCTCKRVKWCTAQQHLVMLYNEKLLTKP